MTKVNPAGRTFRRLHQDHDEHCEATGSAGGYCSCPEDLTTVTEGEADLICSDVEHSEGLAHRPVIDLDFPCQLVPSATPGHFHLYIDKTISWSQFEQVLFAMTRAGLVQKGYLDATRRRGYAAVRHPDKPKVLS